MTTLVEVLRSGFLPELLAGMVVNLEIAAISLVLGVLLGVPLGLVQAGRGLGGRLASFVLGLMRAAPTFVVMFFLLNIIPYQLAPFGIDVTPSETTIVALSLVPYAAAYAADNGREAVAHMRVGETALALLFLPNIVRAFVVLVMASSAAAAIGVNEGVAAVLREADRWPDLGDKLVVFAIGVFVFGVIFQTGFALVRIAVRRITRRRRDPAAA